MPVMTDGPIINRHLLWNTMHYVTCKYICGCVCYPHDPPGYANVCKCIHVFQVIATPTACDDVT